MTTNLSVTANVKQLRTVGSFRILLPFFRTSWCVGVLNSAILTVFTIRLILARFWRGFGIWGGGGGGWDFETSVRHLLVASLTQFNGGKADRQRASSPS